MMKKDLKRAHAAWIDEAENNPAEAARRQESEFLKHENCDGLYADFHNNRHLFITSLKRAGLSPKMAQTLARHSDIRLTLGVYTHIGIHDQTVAIGWLPAPSSESSGQTNKSAESTTTRTNGSEGEVPQGKTAASGAQNGAERVASAALQFAPICAKTPAEGENNRDQEVVVTPDGTKTFRTERGESASRCIAPSAAESQVHPTGFEPVTFGSVDRCSDAASVYPGNSLDQQSADMVPSMVPCSVDCSHAGDDQTLAQEQLAWLGASWLSLPESTRAAVLTLLDAVLSNEHDNTDDAKTVGKPGERPS